MPGRRSSQTRTDLRASMQSIRPRPRPRRGLVRCDSPDRQSIAHRACASRRRIRPRAPRQESGRRQRHGTPPAAPAERGISICVAILKESTTKRVGRALLPAWEAIHHRCAGRSSRKAFSRPRHCKAKARGQECPRYTGEATAYLRPWARSGIFFRQRTRPSFGPCRRLPRHRWLRSSSFFPAASFSPKAP